MSFFQYDFMRNAFLAGTAVAILAGLIGVLVVNRGVAFLAHNLADMGFAGASFAIYLGWPPELGMLLFTLSGAAAVARLGLQAFHREVATGITLSFFLGLGLLFLTISRTQSSTAVSVLFGGILGISQVQVWRLATAAAVVLIALVLLARPLLIDTFDPIGAQARGLRVDRLGLAFLLMLAVAVAAAVQVVGSLLVFTLLVAPAATARRLTSHLGRMFALSAGIAVASVWSGLVLAYYIPAPVTFYVALVSTGAYILSGRRGLVQVRTIT